MSDVSAGRVQPSARVVKWLGDRKETNVHAVVVVRHGKLVFDHYFTGGDEHLGQSVGEVTFDPQTRHDAAFGVQECHRLGAGDGY